MRRILNLVVAVSIFIGTASGTTWALASDEDGSAHGTFAAAREPLGKGWGWD